MLKIWSQKQQQAAEGSKHTKKVSAAFLRAQKDIAELSLPPTMSVHFPKREDIFNFELKIEPDEGMYRGGSFNFTFVLNNNFPHEAPKVKCTQKIYHPNIDLAGNVCLNILREDWTPVLNLNAVMIGLQFLFLEPNADDPLNTEAADDMRSTEGSFKDNVWNSMEGGYFKDIQFDCVLKY